MQTFLPYPDFDKSASVLDPSRLGNQAYKEGRILLGGGWTNHPASKMWRGYERALAEYILACFRELTRRGKHYSRHIAEVSEIREALSDTGAPWWIGDERFHSAHRSILLAKRPDWYSKFGWTENPAVMIEGRWPYYWPV